MQFRLTTKIEIQRMFSLSIAAAFRKIWHKDSSFSMIVASSLGGVWSPCFKMIRGAK